MEIRYRNYTNGSRPFLRGYRRGDVLIAGWTDTVNAEQTLDAHALAERVWIRHNRDDRPDVRLCPSMSVGDVVVIGETALTVESIGFSVCSIDPGDVVDGLPWREWIHSAQAVIARTRR